MRKLPDVEGNIMNDEGEGSGDFTVEVDLGSNWAEDTEDDSTLLRARYYTGEPGRLWDFLTGPAAGLTLDSYSEDGAARPTLAEVVDLLLQRPGIAEQPDVRYCTVPAGPAVRLEGSFTLRTWGGLRQRKGRVITYAVAPPGLNEIIELTVTWSQRHDGPEVADLADALIPTLRIVPVSGQGISDGATEGAP